MSKIFVKNGGLELKNGGYLVTGKAETPVFNGDFVVTQRHAEWVVTFAEKAKGKDFVGKTADSLASVKAEVAKALAKSNVEYVTAPTKVVGDLTAKLHDEAMAFVNFNRETSKTDKVNAFLQSFNIINEYETFGIYCTEEITKLNRIYTMKEVIAAVTEVIDILD